MKRKKWCEVQIKRKEQFDDVIFTDECRENYIVLQSSLFRQRFPASIAVTHFDHTFLWFLPLQEDNAGKRLIAGPRRSRPMRQTSELFYR